MVKEKASCYPPEEDFKPRSAAKTTKQTMRGKLSSTDRRDMLATIYQRTHSAAKTSSSRSATWKKNANCGTNQRDVKLPNSSGGQSNRPVLPIQPMRGSLEDTPTKQASHSVSKSTSSPDLKKLNDGRERVRFSVSQKEDGQKFHQHYHSSRPYSRSSKNIDAVEVRLGKHVAPSIDRKSSQYADMPRKSDNYEFFSSSKSEKQSGGYEKVDVSLNRKEVPRSVSGGPKSKYVIEDKHGKQSSPPLPKSRKDDSCGRVGWTEAPRKKLICNDGPVDVILPTKEVRAPSSMIEHLANSSVSSVPVKAIPICNSDAFLNNREPKKRKSPDALYDSMKYPRNRPAMEIIWKGAFEVLNLSHEMGFCEGFMAHPAAQVSAKAYKFSKQLTGVLKFKLDSRSELWPEPFKTRSPDWNDIALYFYPDRNERSRNKYSNLLQYMVKKDLLLRCVIGDVELLGFASKTLALDCQQMKGNYFMWGVFRRLKGKTRTLRDISRKQKIHSKEATCAEQ